MENRAAVLGSRFTDALLYASDIHGEQRRKGSDVPYIGHLLGVASILIDLGDQDEVIAGLLHDAVEDQGGLERARDIRARFGDRIAEIVLACSDATPELGEEKPPWDERKTAYRAHLSQSADASVLLVSAADKLHNLRSMWFDYQSKPDALWSRFSASAEQSLHNYGELAKIYSDSGDPRLKLIAKEMFEFTEKLRPRDTA